MAKTIYPYLEWTFGISNAFFLKDVSGLGNIPKHGPFILACNHVSVPDEWVMAAVVYSVCREPVWYLARDDYWLSPWWTNFLKDAFATLLIDWRKPSSVLEKANHILRNKGVVGIYPEGTRNIDPKSLALGKTGVARLALATGAPVIPVGYYGPPIAKVLDIVKNFIIKRNTASLDFGPPVDLQEFQDKPIDRKLLYEATDKIMVKIGALCNKKPRLHF